MHMAPFERQTFRQHGMLLMVSVDSVVASLVIDIHSGGG